MTNCVDTVFEWKSPGDRQLNKCRLRIYWLTWEKAIIIATNLSDRSQTQVGDATEEIISFANNYHNLAPNKIMLVEHYLTDDPLQDTYVQILLIDSEPIRYQVSQHELTELIGKPI